MREIPIYIRVSSDEQVDGTSLSTQLAQCRDALIREGFTPGRVFSDEGESAKTADRPQFLALLDFVEKERPPAVVVWKCDRFARNMLDAQIVRAQLHKCGCRLISATEPINDDPSGKFLFDMLSAVAEYDNRLRAERSRIGMSARVKAGCWLHAPPLGYHAARTEDGQPTLSIDPFSGPLVAELFRLVSSGASQADAARKINAAGLRTRSGRPLTKQTIGNMLTRPVYAGRLAGALADVNGVSTRKGNWEPIVNVTTWAEVQKRLRVGTQTIRTRDEFPLKGRVVCGVCGKPAAASFSTGRGGAKHGYYHCLQCPKIRTRIELVDDAIRRTLAGMALAPDIVKVLDWQIDKTMKKQWAEVKAKRSLAGRRAEALTAKLDKLIEMRVEEGGGGPAYRRQLDAKIAIVEGDLQAAVAERSGAEWEGFDYLAEFRRAKEMLVDPSGWWERAPALTRNMAWPLFFTEPLRLTMETKKGWNHLPAVPAASNWLPRLDLNQRPAD